MSNPPTDNPDLLPIVRLGHPALRSPAQPVDPKRLEAEEIQTLIDRMLATMRAADGVGLAAPQVDLDLQLFVYLAFDGARPPMGEVDAALQTDETVPQEKVIVNPFLEPVPGELVYDWEGCLSIPDLRGLVPRHPAVRVHGLDRHGKALDFRAEGYEARIVQHEHDHLNGMIFLDRMRDLRSLAFSDEWAHYLAAEDDEH